MSDFLSFLPAFRRLSYLNSLFEWLEAALENSRTYIPQKGYPEIPHQLTDALTRLGEEIGSTDLLQLCIKLDTLNIEIRAANKESGSQYHATIDLHVDHIPEAKGEYASARQDCKATAWARLTYDALAIIAIAFGSALVTVFLRIFCDRHFY